MDSLAGNTCAYLFTVQFADVHVPAGASSEDESFLTEAPYPVEKLESKDIFRSLVEFPDPALIDFTLVDLPVVLALRNNQQRLAKTLGIQVLRHDEGIAGMCFRDILLFPPVFRDVAVCAADLDAREHILQSLHQCFTHDAHEGSVPCGLTPALRYRQLNPAIMVSLVAILAKRN